MSSILTTDLPRESPTEKILSDARIWADVWRMPIGPFLWLRLVLFEPGFQVALSLRLQEMLTSVPVVGRALRRALWYATTVWHSCDISPSAKIGGGLFLPHPTGVVIGGDCTIGRRVRILQHVTIGITALTQDGSPESIASPNVGDDARIMAGAVVVGGITLGRGCIVGSNAVVLKDVPAGCSAVGVPARILPPKTSQDSPHAD